MKNILSLIGITLALTSVSAQVAIEKETVTNSSVILEFNDQRHKDGKAKALILPVTDSLKEKDVPQGALWLDANTGIVKYKAANATIAMSTPSKVTISAPEIEKNSGKGVVIGKEDEKIDGVLVLNSESKKSMILPVVNNVKSIGSQTEPGMIVYDKASKSIAVFNGSEWHFWN